MTSQRYVDGKAFKYSRLLEKVESFYKSTLWRRYLLSYQNRGVDLPVQLDCETESGKLTPLRFKYGDEGALSFLVGVLFIYRSIFRILFREQFSQVTCLVTWKFSRASKSEV